MNEVLKDAKSMDITIDSFTLAVWKKLCDRKGYKYNERMALLMTMDVDYLRTVKVTNPDLIVKSTVKAMLRISVSEELQANWFAEINRLKIKKPERATKLMQIDIPALEKLPDKVVPDTNQKMKKVSSYLPVKVVESWHNVCDDIGIAYSKRLTILLKKDVPYLESLEEIEKTPYGELLYEFKYYPFTLGADTWETWQNEINRLEMPFNMRIAQLIEADTTFLMRFL